MESFFITKYILYFVIASLEVDTRATQLVIFARDEVCNLRTQNAPCRQREPLELSFITNVSGTMKSDRTEIVSLRLDAPPPDWGRKVTDNTYGQIIHHTAFPSGFVADVHLYDLTPDHHYVLTLNGSPSLDGNNLLPMAVPHNPQEKYYDFLDIYTDDKGEYHASLGVYLKPGAYHIRFYVKDPDDYKIVLFHDYFRFTVK